MDGLRGTGFGGCRSEDVPDLLLHGVTPPGRMLAESSHHCLGDVPHMGGSHEHRVVLAVPSRPGVRWLTFSHWMPWGRRNLMRRAPSSAAPAHRAGSRSLHPAWVQPGVDRDWDLHLLPYQEVPEPIGLDVVVADVVPGPKWTGIRGRSASPRGRRSVARCRPPARRPPVREAHKAPLGRVLLS